MSETASLGLSLLQPSQAQKHVTVNEGLIRLDGLVQLSIISRQLAVPPVGFADGETYVVAHGGTDAWAGRDGNLAIASNGGWAFIEPRDGWQGWLKDEGCRVVYASGSWQAAALCVSESGAASKFWIKEAEVSLQAGGAQFLAPTVPKDSVVFACSARVTSEITGSLASWSLGLDNETGKFGQGMGPQSGSYCTGLLSQPTAYYASFQPYFTPVGGVVSGGSLKVAVHYFALELPA